MPPGTSAQSMSTEVSVGLSIQSFVYHFPTSFFLNLEDKRQRRYKRLSDEAVKKLREEMFMELQCVALFDRFLPGLFLLHFQWNIISINNNIYHAFLYVNIMLQYCPSLCHSKEYLFRLFSS